MHYPSQLLRSNSLDLEYIPNMGIKSGKVKAKNFRIDNLEVIRKRNTGNTPCNTESTKDNEHIISKLLEKTKCKPPHWIDLKYPQVCNNSHSIANTNIDACAFDNPDFFKEFDEPCDQIKIITFNVQELNRGFNESTDTRSDLTLAFKSATYKEIIHIRSFDMESLVGNMGGYVGLLLGFAIWQVPDAIKWVLNELKRVMK